MSVDTRIRFLSFVLLGNAIFSLFSGFLIAKWNHVLVAWLGLPDTLSLLPTGIILILFGCLLVWITVRLDVMLPLVRTVIYADVGWVMGSAILIATGFFGALGIPVAAIVAEIVLLFALFQYFGLRKIRNPMPVWKFLLFASVLLVLFGMFVMGTARERLMDLHSLYIKPSPPDAARIEKGRQLLQTVAQQHGLESWKTFRVEEVTARDLWVNPKFSWWPDGDQEFRSQSLLRSFTSRMELVGGSEDGKILGIQSWKGYVQNTSGSKPVHTEENRIHFYLPTLQYFHELPFRLISAPLVTYAGQADHQGKTYDLVFVTWGSWQASDKYDQYALWIDPATHLIRMAHYTVREAFRSASGTIHFTDYRDVQGIQVAFEQTVIVGGPSNSRYPLKEHFFHRLEIKDVHFQKDVPDELIPWKDVPEGSDRKPRSQ